MIGETIRLIFIQHGTGYCGEDDATVVDFDPFVKDNEIESVCQNIATEWAESFDHEDSDDIWWVWEDYVPEEHDMYRPGGGSFLEDF